VRFRCVPALPHSSDTIKMSTVIEKAARRRKKGRSNFSSHDKVRYSRVSYKRHIDFSSLMLAIIVSIIKYPRFAGEAARRGESPSRSPSSCLIVRNAQ